MLSVTSGLLSLSPKWRIQSIRELEFRIVVTLDLDTGSGYIPEMAGVSGMHSRNLSNSFLNSSNVPIKFLMWAGNILNIPPPWTDKDDCLIFLTVEQCLDLILGMVTILPRLSLLVQIRLHCGTKPFLIFQI